MTDHSKALAAFPDISAADLPDLPEGWRDESWHNDVCPSYQHDESGLQLYAEVAKREDREWPETDRYCLRQMDWDRDHGWQHASDAILATGEELAPILAIAAPIIADAALAAKAADAAANAMALAIQEALDIEAGDLAALWFDGTEEDTLKDMARRYIRAERSFAAAEEADDDNTPDPERHPDA